MGHRRSDPPRVLFLGTMYAGHHTRFINLRAHTETDHRIEPTYRGVSGWRPDGVIERLPILPPAFRGRARALLECGSLASPRRPDVIWTSVGDELLAPYLWTQLGPMNRPVVLDVDSTPGLLERDAELYFGRPPRSGWIRKLLRLRERVSRRSVAWFSAWSRWAADALEAEGVPPSRISVLPPGVDLIDWTYVSRAAARPVKLLFVGGDFERKGGQQLLDAVRPRLCRGLELDVVTRSHVREAPGIRVHRAGPNSPELRRLYADAHLFVMPSRAECFGIAAVEAMATGLPVVMGDAGAAREIVDHGMTGWVVPPRREELAALLDHVAEHPEELPAMGRLARLAAEDRYDGRRNARSLVDLLLRVANPA